GKFAFSERYQVNTDWDAWLRLAEQIGEFIYVREALLDHRLHAQAVTAVSVSEGHRQREDRMIMARLWPRWLVPLVAGAYGASLLTKRWQLPALRRAGPACVEARRGAA
ncbi:MAG: hypothetical protein QME74_01455, partial [Candidatus Edwardsbacteria bacterium]|nr:hypothetical protein [Candidatus Edwardsbacteria bacterium]